MPRSDLRHFSAPEDCDGDVGGVFNHKPLTTALPDHIQREILELEFPGDGGSAYYQNPKANFEQLPRKVKYFTSMASETVVSEHPALSEEIEKKEQLEVKKMESENVSAQKEKPEEPACPAATESEAKTIDEKQIEPPSTVVVVEHVKDDIIKAGEKPKTDDEDTTKPVVVELPPVEVEKKTESAEPIEQKTEDTNKSVVVELPPVEDEKKTEPTEPIEQKTEDINRSVVELPPKEEEKDAPIPEQSIEKVESVVDEISECEPAGKQEEETKAGPTEETKPEEPAKNTVDAPEVIEEKIEKEAEKPVATEKVDKVEPEPVEKVEVEIQTLPREEKDVECYPADEVKEKNVPAEETVEIKEKIAEPGKIDESEAPGAKSEEKSVLTEELVQCEEKSTEGARISGHEPKAEEKAAEDQEVMARDIEQPVVEPEKIEENVQAAEEKTEENFDDIKPDVVQNQECAKEIDQGDAKKDASPVKTQKQSIVKIVKQSLVKAKKAIIGKSQTSKTPDDGNK